MFTNAAQRRFEVLLFCALDRLTREGALETLQYLNQLSHEPILNFENKRVPKGATPFDNYRH